MEHNRSEDLSNTCKSRSLDVLVNFEQPGYIYWINVITCVLNGTTCLTAIIGNSLVLIAILTTSMRRQQCMLVLCSLAMADFLVGLLVQPSYLIHKIAEINQQWILVCYTKVVHVCVGFATTGVSLVSLMAIAIERLLAVRLHLRYAEIVTRRRVKVAIALIWIFTVLLTLLQFVEKDVFHVMCLTMEVISIVITAFAYHKVYKIVQRHRKEIEKHTGNFQNQIDAEKYRKSAMTMFLIFMFSLLCYLPFSVYLAFESIYGYTPWIKAFANIATTIICMISSFNPCIYCFRIQEIRQAVAKIRPKRKRRTISITAVVKSNSNLSQAPSDYQNHTTPAQK